MNDSPIPIKRDEPLLSNAERKELDKARNQRTIQWVFLGLISVIVLSLFVPLGVFLTRLAMGQ